MRAKVQHGVGLEVLAQVTVKRTEGMGGGTTALKQQSHGVALVAKTRLQHHHRLPQFDAQNEQLAAIAELGAGCRTPFGLDLLQPGFAPHMVTGGDAMQDIGLGAMHLGIALQQAFSQLIHAGGHLHGITLLGQALQGVVQGFEHRQERGGADVSGLGREIEQHDRQFALGTGFAAHRDPTRDPLGEHVDALKARMHVVVLRVCIKRARLCATLTLAACGTGATCKDGGGGGAVQFGDRHHDGALHRQQTALGLCPLVDRLKFQRMGAHIRHVQLFEQGLCGLGIVVSGPAHQGKSRQGEQGVDLGLTLAHEKLLHCRSRIQATGKRGDDPKAARLAGLDHRVIVCRVAREQVRAQHQ